MAIVTTVTTTPLSKTTPSDPCAPSVVGRKYGSKESALAQEASAPNKETSVLHAWALPLLGVVVSVSFATFVAVRVRWGQRSTRQIQFVQDEELGGTPFVSNDLE